MPNEHASTGVIYHGVRRDNGGAVILVENLACEQIGVVKHLPKHSPTGINWGFAGSGAADAARSLLIAVMGPEAICPICQGTNNVVYVRTGDTGALVAEPYDPERHHWTKHGWQCECDGGYKRTPYPAFTEAFVRQWGDEWVMDQASILDWLATNLKDWDKRLWSRPVMGGRADHARCQPR